MDTVAEIIPPIRVLHLIGRMDRGGIETWLMNLLRQKRPEWRFDFLVFHQGAYDREAEELGARFIRLPFKRPAFKRFQKNYRNILYENNYDVVHYHHREFSGSIMQIAYERGVPVRIDHSHNSGRTRGRSWVNLVKECYRRFVDEPKIDRYATHLLACSREAGRFSFGKLWTPEYSEKMVYCGIPIHEFEVDRNQSVRKIKCGEYHIPEDSIVIGSLGRLTYQKNYEFLIGVFSELAQRDNRYVLFIAGEGELRTDLEKQVEARGLQNRVFLPGSCSDVPELTTCLFDVFVLPSHYEGFGIVFLEAAASGLHSVCSDVITQDILDRIPECFTPLSLTAPVSSWCDAIEEGIRKRETPRAGVERIRKTPFTIENSVEALLQIYRSNQ